MRRYLSLWPALGGQQRLWVWLHFWASTRWLGHIIRFVTTFVKLKSKTKVFGQHNYWDLLSWAISVFCFSVSTTPSSMTWLVQEGSSSDTALPPIPGLLQGILASDWSILIIIIPDWLEGLLMIPWRKSRWNVMEWRAVLLCPNRAGGAWITNISWWTGNESSD